MIPGAEYESARQTLILDDLNNSDKLREPATAQTIAKYYADISVRVVEIQSNSKIDLKVAWTIYGPDGRPAMPPFPVILYKRTSAVSDIFILNAQDSITFNAVDDREVNFQVVAHARTGYKSWHVGLSEGVNVRRSTVLNQFPARSTNYSLEATVGTRFCGPYGKYPHNGAISGPAVQTPAPAPLPVVITAPAPIVEEPKTVETVGPSGQELIAQYQALKALNPEITTISRVDTAEGLQSIVIDTKDYEPQSPAQQDQALDAARLQALGAPSVVVEQVATNTNPVQVSIPADLQFEADKRIIDQGGIEVPTPTGESVLVLPKEPAPLPVEEKTTVPSVIQEVLVDPDTGKETVILAPAGVTVTDVKTDSTGKVIGVTTTIGEQKSTAQKVTDAIKDQATKIEEFVRRNLIPFLAILAGVIGLLIAMATLKGKKLLAKVGA